MENDVSYAGVIDMVFFWGYLLTIVSIGVWAGRSVKSLQDYSTGGRSFSSFFVFTTLSASFIGGGLSIGLTEKVFTLGLAYVVAVWGFSLKEILIARYIAPRMEPFRKTISVGDIMGQLYGHNAKTLTGIAGALVCAGIAGAQFSAFGYVIYVLLGIPPTVGIIVGSIAVILYSTLGGMRSIVMNDTIHCCVLIITLPPVALFGINYVGGLEALWSKVPVTQSNILTSLPPLSLLGWFLTFFFGETLVPPYVQRLLIGRSVKDTVRGTLLSGLFSIPFLFMVGLIGLVALAIDPGLNANLALPHVIQTVMPVGIKGLAIAGVMAILLSSADSFLNAAAVSAVHDFWKPLRQKPLSDKLELLLTRGATFLMGASGAFFALKSESAIDALLYAYNFWTPFILVPLVAGIMGWIASARTFWISSVAGVLGMVTWLFVVGLTENFDAAIVGIGVNLIVFFSLRSFEKIAFQNMMDPVTAKEKG
jgi:SSS family solute:Na+ symporter